MDQDQPKMSRSLFDGDAIHSFREAMAATRSVADLVAFWEAFLREGLSDAVELVVREALLDEENIDMTELRSVDWLTDEATSPQERLAYRRGVADGIMRQLENVAKGLRVGTEDLVDTVGEQVGHKNAIHRIVADGRGF